MNFKKVNIFGFTVVETLIAVSILSLVIGVAYRFLQVTFLTQPKMNDQLELQNEALLGIAKLNDIIRECSDIIRPKPGESWPYCVLRSAENHIVFFYVAENGKDKNNKPIYQLVYLIEDYSNNRKKAKTIFPSLADITFTCTNPSSIIVKGNLEKNNSKIPFLTEIGLMNIEIDNE